MTQLGIERRQVWQSAVVVSTIILILILGGYQIVTAQSDRRPPAIIEFRVDFRDGDPTLLVEQSETGIATATLVWRTVNLGTCRLQLDYLTVTDWTPLSTQGFDETLAPSGSLLVSLIHPLNYGPVMYRLGIVDEDDRVLDFRMVQIPFTATDDVPTVQNFERINVVPTNNINTFDVEVLWQVAHRQPMTNLEFYQRIGDQLVRDTAANLRQHIHYIRGLRSY